MMIGRSAPKTPALDGSRLRGDTYATSSERPNSLR